MLTEIEILSKDIVDRYIDYRNWMLNTTKNLTIKIDNIFKEIFTPDFFDYLDVVVDNETDEVYITLNFLKSNNPLQNYLMDVFIDNNIVSSKEEYIEYFANIPLVGIRIKNRDICIYKGFIDSFKVYLDTLDEAASECLNDCQKNLEINKKLFKKYYKSIHFLKFKKIKQQSLLLNESYNLFKKICNSFSIIHRIISIGMIERFVYRVNDETNGLFNETFKIVYDEKGEK